MAYLVKPNINPQKQAPRGKCVVFLSMMCNLRRSCSFERRSSSDNRNQKVQFASNRNVMYELCSTGESINQTVTSAQDYQEREILRTQTREDTSGDGIDLDEIQFKSNKNEIRVRMCARVLVICEFIIKFVTLSHMCMAPADALIYSEKF